MWNVILAASAVVILSALFSMIEAAFLSLPLVRAQALAKIGGRTARTVLRIRQKVHNALSVLVILDTVVDITGSALVTTMAVKAAEEAAARGDLVTVSVATVTTVLTVAIILFGEILPKTFGERYHVGVTLSAAYPVLVMITLLHPLVWLSDRIIGRMFPGRRRNVTSAEEISAMAEEASREGTIGHSEADVIQRVFRLSDITAGDVMTPRIRARMLPADATLEESRGDLFAIGFSRIPLYSGTRDNVAGILRRADALRALAEGKGGTRLSELAAKAKFVPATMVVDQLLREFQRERVQLAVVVGEYGETVGVVSLEDILEELVGEILDEKDVSERSIKRISRDEILVHGQTEIGHINHFFNTEIPEDRPTIAGFLLDRLGRIPKTGEHVVAEGIDL